MKEIKIGFGLSQFAKQNTPKIAQLIGNASLILAGIAAIPVVLSTAGIAVPALIVTVGVYASAGGILVKKISKLFGIVESDVTETTTA